MTRAANDVQAFLAIEPHRFAVVRELRLTAAPDAERPYRLDLSLRLAPDEQPADETLIVRCGDVQQLELTQTTAPLRISALQVRDVTHRGWALLRYRVIDLEEEVLRLYCSEFRFEVVRADGSP